MTDGSFFYSSEGKCFKRFGPDDADALSCLSKFMEIRFVTGDKKGWTISEKRIFKDMGYPIDLVSTLHRIEWIEQRYDIKDVIYMGDGIFDHFVMRQVSYSIAPSNAFYLCKQSASFTTNHRGGDRAVAEACLHLMEKFSLLSNISELGADQFVMAKGEWVQ